MILEFDICKQTMKRTDNERVVNLSQEYLELGFNFKGTDWDDKSKFVLFTKNGEKYRVPVEDDKVVVPWNVLTGDHFVFMVYGVAGDVRVTTNQVRVYLAESGFGSGGDAPDPIDPDVVEVIFEALDGKSDKGHTHVKDDISDFPTVVSVFSNDVGYLTEHQSLRDYYNKSEVDELLEDLKDKFDNRVILSSDKRIVQVDDELDLRAFVLRNGVPQVDKEVVFYDGVDIVSRIVLGSAVTDVNGVACLDYVGSGRGLMDVVSVVDVGGRSLVSETYVVTDCILYDAISSSSSLSNYYSNTTYETNLEFVTGKGLKLTCGTRARYVQYGGANGITTDLSRFKGKTIRFKAYVEPSAQCRLQIHQYVDGAYITSSSEYTSEDGEISIDADIDSTATRVIFRIEGDTDYETIYIKDFEVYPI